MAIRHIITAIPNTPINIEILQGVFGQLSDGIWENSKKMKPFWLSADVCTNSKYVSFEVAHVQSFLYLSTRHSNPYFGIKDSDVVRSIADRIPKIIHREAKDYSNQNKNFRFTKGNYERTQYLSYQLPITIHDCYILYHALIDSADFLDYVEQSYTAHQIICLQKVRNFDFSQCDTTKDIILPLNNSDYLKITRLQDQKTLKISYLAYYGTNENGLIFPLEDKPENLYDLRPFIKEDLRGFSPSHAARNTVKYSNFAKTMKETIVDNAVMSKMSLKALKLQLNLLCKGLNIDTTSEWITKNSDIF